MEDSVQRGWMNGLGRRQLLLRIEWTAPSWFNIDLDIEIVVGGCHLA